MDRYNCISISNNIDELDLDMNNWMLLPFDMRKRSNEISLQKYGCTNEQLYNILKAKLLAYDNIDKVELESMIYKSRSILTEAMHNIKMASDKEYSEYPDGYTVDGSINSKLNKIQMSRAIMNTDDDIVIIPDFIDDKNPDYTIDQLENMYRKYYQANTEHRHRSDHYSVMIWGYTVLDMYNYIKQKFESEEYHKEIPLSQDVTSSDKELENYKDTVEQIDDNIELQLKQIDALAGSSNRTLSESVFLEGFSNKIKIKGKTYRQGMPEVTPFLTYDEYVNNPRCLDMKKICRVDPFTYVLNYMDSKNRPYEDIREAYSNHDEDKLLKLGWNPVVEPTSENFKFARERQIKWFDEFFHTEIYDLSKYKTRLNLDSLNESISMIEESKKLDPIYIIGVKENYLEDEWLNKHKYSKFGIAFDPSLLNIYHRNSVFDRLDKEDLKNFSGGKEITIFTVFSTPKNVLDLKNRINNKFNSNSKINRIEFNNRPNNFGLEFQLNKFICDTLDDCGYHYYNGIRDNIVRQQYSSQPKKIITLFDDKTDKFDTDELDLKTKALQRNNGFNKKYQIDDENISEFVHQRLIENFDIISENSSINEIIKNIRESVCPCDMFNSLPETKTFEDMVNQYNFDHKILSTFDQGNIDGIKKAVEDLYNIKDSLIFKKKFIDESEIQDYNNLIELIEQDIFMYRNISN